MKLHLLALICLAGSAFAAVEPPGLIAEGVDAYIRNGAKAGLAVWTRGSALENVELKGFSVDGFNQIEKSYGRLIGFETIRAVPVSPSMQRVYILLKYENGPAYASFDCYWTRDQWIIPMMNYNAKPAAVLPERLLVGVRE